MSSLVSAACGTIDPDIGPRLDNGKWRALVGWNHTNDTVEGLKRGKIWAWVSAAPEKFQVYDQNFNRGGIGEVRDCGVANFTMVRMFHPYWCLIRRRRGGVRMLETPKDGRSSHKRYCRKQYNKLIKKHRQSLGLPVDESDIEDADVDEIIPVAKETTKEAKKKTKARSTGTKRKHRASKKNAQALTNPPEEEGDYVDEDSFDPMIVNNGNQDANNQQQPSSFEAVIEQQQALNTLEQDKQDFICNGNDDLDDPHTMLSPEDDLTDMFNVTDTDIDHHHMNYVADYLPQGRLGLMTELGTSGQPIDDNEARNILAGSGQQQSATWNTHNIGDQQDTFFNTRSDGHGAQPNTAQAVTSTQEQPVSTFGSENVDAEIKSEGDADIFRFLKRYEDSANAFSEGTHDNPIVVD